MLPAGLAADQYGRGTRKKRQRYPQTLVGEREPRGRWRCQVPRVARMTSGRFGRNFAPSVTRGNPLVSTARTMMRLWAVR